LPVGHKAHRGKDLYLSTEVGNVTPDEKGFGGGWRRGLGPQKTFMVLGGSLGKTERFGSRAWNPKTGQTEVKGKKNRSSNRHPYKEGRFSRGVEEKGWKGKNGGRQKEEPSMLVNLWVTKPLISQKKKKETLRFYLKSVTKKVLTIKSLKAKAWRL